MSRHCVFYYFIIFACVAICLPISAADELRVGFTYAKKSTSQLTMQALEIWATQINNTGGIVLDNGTTLFVKLISYDDNENCELVDILYERLVLVNQVHVFFHPGAGNCQAAALIAERYHVPTLNARSAYVAYQWLNHTWVYTLFPPFTGVTDGCNAALNDAGALSRVIQVSCNESSGLALPQQFSDGKYNTTYVEKLAMPSAIWAAATADNTTQRTYIATQVKRWKKMNPSAMIWSGCGSVSFLDALHRTKWTPPALFSYGATSLNAFRARAGWQAEGLLSIAANDYSENFTDPVFGDTQQYVTMFRSMYNDSTPDTLTMTLSALGVILSESVKIAQTLEPFALRDAISSYSAIIFYGPVAFKNYLMARPDPCYQHTPGDKLVPVWPKTYPTYQPLVYPYYITYPAEFLLALQPKANLALRYGLIGMGCGLLVIAIVVLILVFFVWKKYSIIFIPNSMSERAEEWGDSPSMMTGDNKKEDCAPGCCIHL